MLCLVCTETLVYLNLCARFGTGLVLLSPSLLVDAIHVCLIWLHAVVDNHDRHFMNTKFHLEFDLRTIQVYKAWIAKFCA
jgi:hypothetical protein